MDALRLNRYLAEVVALLVITDQDVGEIDLGPDWGAGGGELFAGADDLGYVSHADLNSPNS